MRFVREPAVSGTFYPDNARALKAQIERYFDAVTLEKNHWDVVGTVSPHAGYMYSGQVAAYGYRTIIGESYDTVVLMAPSHRMHFDGAAVLDKGSYRTPLGLVDVDEDLARDMLAADPVVQRSVEAHQGEHSLEVQLPFLQVALKGFRIVPLIMGSQRVDECEKLARCLMHVLGGTNRHVLLVGSTDLSHYYPYESALRLDGAIVKHLEAFDTPALVADLKTGKGEACGAGP